MGLTDGRIALLQKKLTRKERRWLEVIGGGLRRRVESLKRQQIVCELVMTRRRHSRFTCT